MKPEHAFAADGTSGRAGGVVATVRDGGVDEDVPTSGVLPAGKLVSSHMSLICTMNFFSARSNLALMDLVSMSTRQLLSIISLLLP